MWGAHEGMGWWMLFGGLWTLLIWALIVGGIIWLVAHLTSADPPPAGSPQDIAEERYARGEISGEELERIRHVLRGAR